MPIINAPIPTLYNGVSQQPPSLRLSSQAEEQINGLSSIVSGLNKRPPFEWIAELDSAVGTIHWTGNEQDPGHLIVIRTNYIKAYEADTGIEVPVESTYPSFDGYLSGSCSVVTIADTTIIANKDKTVAALPTLSPSFGTTSYFQNFEKLPATNATNTLYVIEGDPTNDLDTYYLKRGSSSSTYVETLNPGEEYALDLTTMPHQLLWIEAENKFVFDRITWKGRAVGNAENNPFPSFVGERIKQVFLHKNRIGFLANANVTLSSNPASDFNFFRESMVALTDADPIDLTATDNSFAPLLHAVDYNKDLLLFSERSQFIMSSQGVLSPKSVVLDLATRFACSGLGAPVGAGPNVYFGSDDGSFCTVREYFIQNDVLTNDAADVTAHVPTYVRGNLRQLVASPNTNQLFALTSLEDLYVYNYFWQGDQKVQSAWSRWHFIRPYQEFEFIGLGEEGADSNGNAFVTKYRKPRAVSGHSINDVLYLLLDDGTYGKIKLTPTEATDEDAALLDFRVKGYFNPSQLVSQNVPDGFNDFEIPYHHNFVLEGYSDDGTYFTPSDIQYLSANKVRVPTDSRYVNFGFPYSLRYTFSEQNYKDRANNIVRDSRTMYRFWEVSFSQTAGFSVEVETGAGRTFVQKFSPRITGSDSAIIGSNELATGSFKFPVQGDSKTTKVTIVNDTPYPSRFEAAEWRGLYVTRSAR